MHLSPTTVIATLALVFAMTGGAYAAKKYLITSTKQISPSVLKALQGKAGPAGANGAAGVQGPAGAVGAKGENGAAGSAGPQGPAGPVGPAGSAGAQGVTGAAGAAGAAGESVKMTTINPGATCEAGGTELKVGTSKEHVCNGKPGAIQPGETLPAGVTETGSWAVTINTEGSGAFYYAPISFTIPLAAPLPAANVEFVKISGTGTHCAGTVEAPTAPEGYLCVYTSAESGLALPEIKRSGNAGESGASTAGAVLGLLTLAGNTGADVGTWAVTAE
jgi:hypothetical protein